MHAPLRPWMHFSKIIENYFANLFSSQVHAPNEEVIQKVTPRVTTQMNDALMAPFTEEDVRRAVFSIGDFKAPGPDGLHAAFYKRFWSMLKDDLVKEVLEAINSRKIPEGWNSTTIVLIPKVENPTNVTQFRPISLCNVVYKII